MSITFPLARASSAAKASRWLSSQSSAPVSMWSPPPPRGGTREGRRGPEGPPAVPRTFRHLRADDLTGAAAMIVDHQLIARLVAEQCRPHSVEPHGAAFDV